MDLLVQAVKRVVFDAFEMLDSRASSSAIVRRGGQAQPPVRD